MDPHPDFAETALPRSAQLPSFRLTPLGPEVAEEDYEAVMSSADVLRGVFGDDWPLGLTLADNRVDMGWHDREFTACRSFAWVVRSPGGEYLGCAYVYPAIGARGAADVVTWVRDVADRAEVMRAFNTEFADWLAPFVPAGVALTWRSSPTV
ncbi:MAG: hypothetical protein QNJ13_15710 [Paracoccaceae bacterium]|nr:hypothetical protein [Paracoccaceae bacterium]